MAGQRAQDSWSGALEEGKRGVRVAMILSLTVGEKRGLPGAQRLVEFLNESQVVKIRENVHHSVIFQQVLQKENRHKARL